MRPVTKDRKSPKTRGASGRLPSRGITRGPAPQPYRRRSGSGFFSRASDFLRRLLDARRAMLWATLTLLLGLGAAVLMSDQKKDRPAQRTGTAAESLAANAGFGVAQVHLAGNVRTTPAEIMAALGLRVGQPIFEVDLHAARARLKALPWVAEAEIKRRYPDDIAVRIVERVAYARWQRTDALYLVERNGRPITARGADTFTHLPLLLGMGAPENAEPFVNAVADHRAIAARVEAYQYVGKRRWNLLLDDGVIVKLPEEGWQKQLRILDHLIVDKGILERDIREIDLRHPSHYFFYLRNGAAEKEKKKTETGSAI